MGKCMIYIVPIGIVLCGMLYATLKAYGDGRDNEGIEMTLYEQKCFCCGKGVIRPEIVFLSDCMSASENYRQYEVVVGPECFKAIKKAGAQGYASPKGGPRLFLFAADAMRARVDAI